ncbi:unnamed protein product [Adineta steineri]|uniref:Uncharacterized protein n=1 Tax=Adineta steineri TaxID=433720 RepID=A0A820FAJ0_9BILA|nr:unnamed protein product [Adineta steineri]
MSNEQKSSSKTLFLIRHGQSLANRDYDESSAYRDGGPLTRALQTCQNALPPSYSGPILVLSEIAEICSSYYSCGQKRNVIQPKFPDTFDWTNIPMDRIWWWQYDQKRQSETDGYTRERMQKFRNFIQERPEQRIAVFAHGDYLYEFQEGKRSYPANCQVTAYKI